MLSLWVGFWRQDRLASRIVNLFEINNGWRLFGRSTLKSQRGAGNGRAQTLAHKNTAFPEEKRGFMDLARLQRMSRGWFGRRRSRPGRTS